MAWLISSKTEDDFYITLLKYASGQMGKGDTVHVQEVIDHVVSEHPNAQPIAVERACFDALEEIPHSESGSSYVSRKENEYPHTLRMDGYFHLLEYTELQEARWSSAIAIRIAIAAIVISTIFAAIQVFK